MRTIRAIAAAAAGIGLWLAANATWAPRASGAEADEAAIKKRAPAFVAAWNAHDAKALAAFWAEDGDFVGPWGRKAAGRAEVEKLFAAEHGAAGPYRESTIEVKNDDVRLVTPDVAVEDLEIGVAGAFAADGAKVATGLFVTLVVKRAGSAWTTVAARTQFRPAPALAPALKGVPAPAGAATGAAGASGSAKSEPVTPEIVKQVMDGLRAVKVTEKGGTQPALGIIERVAKAAGVTVVFTPGAQKLAEEKLVEIGVEGMDAAMVFDMVAPFADLKWSVAGKGIVRFEEK